MKFIINTCWFLPALWLLAGSAVAQTLSLDSVLQVIEKNNPTLQQYSRQVEAMQAYAEGATAWQAPMVGAGTFMTPYPAQEVTEARNQGMLMFALEQQIPHPAKLQARKAYDASQAAIEVAGQAQAFNMLKAAAKTAYYQWVVLEKKLVVLRENQDVVQTMLKLAEVRYPYAQGSLGDVYLAEAQVGQVNNMILMTQSGIAQQQVQLNTLMNLPADVRYDIDTASSFAFEIAVADTARLARQRSDVEQLDRTIQRMQLNTQLISLESKPDFRLQFSHMSPWAGVMPNQFTLMGMLSIPIVPWASKAYQAETRGMRYEVRALQQQRTALLNEAQGRLTSLMLEINSLQQQLENYREKILPALRKNYQVLMLAYEENTEELPRVVDAWQALNAAQLQYLDQLTNYYVRIVDYEKELER